MRERIVPNASFERWPTSFNMRQLVLPTNGNLGLDIEFQPVKIRPWVPRYQLHEVVAGKRMDSL